MKPLKPGALGPVIQLVKEWSWLAAGLSLYVLVFAAFWPASQCDFICYDDPSYVTSNPNVTHGFSWEGLSWALFHSHSSNWHPITWVSHMLDCQWYGLAPAGHHLTNILLHSVNCALVFFVLWKMTRAFWRSVVVAALFGLHPLHVESVAWVSERKDVLSALFFLLTILAYVRYAQTVRFTSHGVAVVKLPGTREERAADPVRAWPWYLTSLAFFALGLMSKSMLVTEPFVLLLLDYWPLARLPRLSFKARQCGEAQKSRAVRAVVEKVPFFLLSAVTVCITLGTQREAMSSLSPEFRISNALTGYCRYLAKFFWPVDLAVFYPLLSYSWEYVLAAALVLSAISVTAIAYARRYPYMPVGWFWYVGTLVPVIGLITVGAQSIADRYTYIPSIGFFLVLVWAAYDVGRGWRPAKVVFATVACLAVLACLACSRRQLGYWRNSELLFRHALAVTGPSWTAYRSLGYACREQRRFDEAVRMYETAIKLDPNSAAVYIELASIWANEGSFEKAARNFSLALKLDAANADVHEALARMLLAQGQVDEAIGQFRESLRLKPNQVPERCHLAAALSGVGRLDEAVREYQQAIELRPDYSIAHSGLAGLFAKQGALEKAVEQYRLALQSEPTNASVHCSLGHVLLRKRIVGGSG